MIFQYTECQQVGTAAYSLTWRNNTWVDDSDGFHSSLASFFPLREDTELVCCTISTRDLLQNQRHVSILHLSFLQIHPDFKKNDNSWVRKRQLQCSFKLYCFKMWRLTLLMWVFCAWNYKVVNMDYKNIIFASIRLSALGATHSPLSCFLDGVRCEDLCALCAEVFFLTVLKLLSWWSPVWEERFFFSPAVPNVVYFHCFSNATYSDLSPPIWCLCNVCLVGMCPFLLQGTASDK